MDSTIVIFIITIFQNILDCHGASLKDQLLEFLKNSRRLESIGRRNLEKPASQISRRNLEDQKYRFEYHPSRRSLDDGENEYQPYRRDLEMEDPLSPKRYEDVLESRKHSMEYLQFEKERPRHKTKPKKPPALQTVWKQVFKVFFPGIIYPFRRLNDLDRAEFRDMRRNYDDDEEDDEYHIIPRRKSYDDDEENKYSHQSQLFRRLYDFHPGMKQTIIGTPTMPGHLPEAEAILPGHTLIRPALGMLKSAVKFPHKDLDNAAGVYGNIDNLGITWDGTGERVLYTGFRRAYDIESSTENRHEKPRYVVALLRSGPAADPKPISRVIKDYYKLELERDRIREERKRKAEIEKEAKEANNGMGYQEMITGDLLNPEELRPQVMLHDLTPAVILHDFASKVKQHDYTPAVMQHDYAPAVMQHDDTPAVMEHDYTPAVMQHDDTPAVMEHDYTPAVMLHDDTPAVMQHDYAPAVMQHDDTPAVMEHDYTPAVMLHDDTPAVMLHDDTPAVMQHDYTPAVMQHDDTPAMCMLHDDTPAVMLHDDTPAVMQHDDTPAVILHDVSPAVILHNIKAETIVVNGIRLQFVDSPYKPRLSERNLLRSLMETKKPHKFAEIRTPAPRDGTYGGRFSKGRLSERERIARGIKMYLRQRNLI